MRLGLLLALGAVLPTERARLVPPLADLLPADLAPPPRFTGAADVVLLPADRRRCACALRRSGLWGLRAAVAAGGPALAIGARPGGDGPAAGACSQITAVPPDVGAGAAAIGDHLRRGQPDAAQPAPLDPVAPLMGRDGLLWACHACSPPWPSAAALANRCKARASAAARLARQPLL